MGIISLGATKWERQVHGKQAGRAKSMAASTGAGDLAVGDHLY